MCKQSKQTKVKHVTVFNKATVKVKDKKKEHFDQKMSIKMVY